MNLYGNFPRDLGVLPVANAGIGNRAQCSLASPKEIRKGVIVEDFEDGSTNQLEPSENGDEHAHPFHA